MAITKQDVDYVARLSRLALSEAERDQFAEQLSAVLNYIDTLNEVDTTNVEPTTHVMDVVNVWRADEAKPFEDTEAIRANAPERDGDYCKVKKVIDQ